MNNQQRQVKGVGGWFILNSLDHHSPLFYQSLKHHLTEVTLCLAVRRASFANNLKLTKEENLKW